jgi:hypothetical protein
LNLFQIFTFSGGFLLRFAPQKSGYPWFRASRTSLFCSGFDKLNRHKTTVTPPLLSLPRSAGVRESAHVK